MKRSSGVKRLGYEALRRLGQPTVQGAAPFIVSGRRSLRHGGLLGKLSSDMSLNLALLSVTRIKLARPIYRLTKAP